jgi:hypothetical protein
VGARADGGAGADGQLVAVPHEDSGSAWTRCAILRYLESLWDAAERRGRRGRADGSRERHLKIGSRRIGPGEPCYVIAEVGINHNGDLGIAKQLVGRGGRGRRGRRQVPEAQAAETYREEIIDQPRHGEQGLQYIVPLLIEFELSDDQFRELFDYCRDAASPRCARRGIAAASTFSRPATWRPTRSARPTSPTFR